MIRTNLKYLAFDDRKLVVLGIPILTFVIPLLFFGVDLSYYWSIARTEFFEGLIYTAIYWLFNRQVIIWVRKRYGGLNQIAKRLGVQLIIVLLTIPFIGFLLTPFCHSIYGLIGLPDLFEPTVFQSIIATYFLVFALTTLYEAVYFFHKYNEAVVEKEQIQRAHIQGQLENLRNQINPHFLFNSLNTLMNLIPTDAERAMNYLSKLAKFYRYTVSKQEEHLVDLQSEMDNVRIYVDLLTERFHQGIRIELPETVPSGARILPLCLQLLIENAVKHNIVAKRSPLCIEVQLSSNEEYIEIKNNIQRKIQEIDSTGMGLKNIRNRVAFYTDAPLVVIEEKDTFRVAVPLIYAK
jgi:sensor histidine kinase YesM